MNIRSLRCGGKGRHLIIVGQCPNRGSERLIFLCNLNLGGTGLVGKLTQFFESQRGFQVVLGVDSLDSSFRTLDNGLTERVLRAG